MSVVQQHIHLVQDRTDPDRGVHKIQQTGTMSQPALQKKRKASPSVGFFKGKDKVVKEVKTEPLSSVIHLRDQKKPVASSKSNALTCDQCGDLLFRPAFLVVERLADFDQESVVYADSQPTRTLCIHCVVLSEQIDEESCCTSCYCRQGFHRECRCRGQGRCPQF